MEHVQKNHMGDNQTILNEEGKGVDKMRRIVDKRREPERKKG